MGLDKLNPFKHKEKATLDKPDDNALAPKKSAADSIRSLGHKVEEFMESGQKPRQVWQDDDGKAITDPNMVIPNVSTAGYGNSLGAMQSPGRFR